MIVVYITGYFLWYDIMFRVTLKNDVVFICVDIDTTWLYLFKNNKERL